MRMELAIIHSELARVCDISRTTAYKYIELLEKIPHAYFTWVWDYVILSSTNLNL